ncbi:helix-turn-helix transcriptional regulator [Nocardia sp. NBC_00416]|uniref:helix-turn-helix transcriptional regulator n=1 Tax=Nocardia sp. NBC_00416 TaxID=2975991 RepID=UPI002E1B7EF7
MFVERRSQIVSLDRIYQQCSEGKGGISQIVGPVAGGKTELLKVFIERLNSEGATVLEAVGSPREYDQPFGILRQLFAGLPDPIDQRRIQRLLTDSVTRPVGSDDGAPFLHNHANQELWATVQRLSDSAPVAVIVDDLQHADLASLQSLLYFGGRLRAARVLIVVTQMDVPLSADQQRAVLVTELLRQPRFRLLRADPLTPDGVRELLTEHLGVAVDQERARPWHRITGGSPFLLKALIEDNKITGRSPAEPLDEPIAGEEFAKAALACLHRGGRIFLRTAECLAALVESGCYSVLPQLVGEDEDTVTGVIAAMSAAGILDGRRFRHPATRTAVLSALSGPARAELHNRAAGLLRDNGERACRVGIHLVAAGCARPPWALDVLMTSAQEALRRDDLGFAAQCLRLAETVSAGLEQRIAVAILRIHTEFRVQPDNAQAQVAAVLDAVRGGRVPVDQMIGLLRPLLWQGRLSEAAVILERLEHTADSLDDRAAADLSSVYTWIRSTHPALAGSGWPTVLCHSAQVAVVANRPVRGPALLADVLESGPTEHTVPTAEWLLRTTPLDGPRLNSIVAALLALAHADRAAAAEQWCNALLDESITRGARTWQALFTALRAEVAIRQGDMHGARRDGLAALRLLPREAWGVAIGSVMSKVLIAATALGDWQTADECLTEMPDAVFDTRYGVQYLYARGRRLLAADRLPAALDDLLTCGRLMDEWGIDQPTFVPWRADAVRVLLRLGREGQAGELAAEQLSRTTDQQPRARGIALRTLAATETDPRIRKETLLRAVDALENCADRVELAYAVADLSDTHMRLGDPRRARQSAQRAVRLAEAGSLAPLLGRLDFGRRLPEPVAITPATSPADTDNEMLSAAERRVVLLAASGHTNREIAAELYITVSTVEQHLTHVYRKLRVKGRGELAAHLNGSGVGNRGAAARSGVDTDRQPLLSR